LSSGKAKKIDFFFEEKKQKKVAAKMRRSGACHGKKSGQGPAFFSKTPLITRKTHFLFLFIFLLS